MLVFKSLHITMWSVIILQFFSDCRGHETVPCLLFFLHLEHLHIKHIDVLSLFLNLTNIIILFINADFTIVDSHYSCISSAATVWEAPNSWVSLWVLSRCSLCSCPLPFYPFYPSSCIHWGIRLWNIPLAEY